MRSAEDVSTMTLKQRAEAGRPPISRSEMSQTVEIMLQASQLSTLPNGGEAAESLRGVKLIASVGQGELTKEEYLAMAKQYTRTNSELKKLFDALSPEQQEEGRAVVRKMQAVADVRRAKLAEEEEKLRVARQRIADENAAQQSQQPAVAEAPTPRRKKTLAELEAAQASFGKQQQPVMSLYAQ